MIEVKNLGKTFLDRHCGEVKAVDAVSFHCRPGETFGLSGPNRAGNTTTLRILSIVLQPTCGRAAVAGYDVVSNAQQVRSHIGFISKSTGSYEKLTPLDFDEPTVSIEVLVAKTVVDFIALCRRENKCILLSTHIMSEAEKLCERIAIIHKGRILATGTLEELKEKTRQADLEAVFFSLVHE